jgi:hypothetical protein
VRKIAVRDVALLLRILAERVHTAQLASGVRILDVQDFRTWFLELSEKAEQVNTIDELFR